MKIRMLVQMSGPRGDGQEWPATARMGGGTITVGDGEGADLVAAGIAEEVPEVRKTETRQAGPDDEAGDERAVVTTPVETRAPAGLTAENTPVTRVSTVPPATARARAQRPRST